MSDKINQYAVSLLYIKQTGNSTINNSLRATVVEKRSHEEALGAAIMSHSSDTTLRDHHLSLYTVMMIEEKVNKEVLIEKENEIDLNLIFHQKTCMDMGEYIYSMDIGKVIWDGKKHIAKKEDLLKINQSDLFKKAQFSSLNRSRFRELVKKIKDENNKKEPGNWEEQHA